MLCVLALAQLKVMLLYRVSKRTCLELTQCAVPRMCTYGCVRLSRFNWRMGAKSFAAVSNSNSGSARFKTEFVSSVCVHCFWGRFPIKLSQLYERVFGLAVWGGYSALLTDRPIKKVEHGQS